MGTLISALNPAPKKLPQIYLVGDSLTERGFNEENSGFGWTLQKYYYKRAEVLNRGYSGFTTRTIQQAFEKYVMQQIREHGTAPLFITIFLGANDACLMQNGTIVPLEEYEDRIREYVNTILNDPATEETKVILISPPPVDVPPPEAASVSRSTAALGRGHQTWLSKRIFAKTIVKIGKEFEAKSDRVATLDFWTIVTKQACHQIYRSFDELDIEGLLPGSGLPGTMEFGKTYFVDRLHMGITAYSLLGNKLMELIANKWPELK